MKKILFVMFAVAAIAACTNGRKNNVEQCDTDSVQSDTVEVVDTLLTDSIS